MKPWLVAIMWLVLASRAVAQVGTEPLAWAPEHRDLADKISTAGVIGQAAAAAAKSYIDWRKGNHRTAWRTLCAGGIAGGTAFGLKSIVSEERPNGYDKHSFPSGHSAWVSALSGWNFTFGVPVASMVGLLRVNANWHHLYKDVMPGLAIGAFSQAGCNALIHS